MSWDSLLFSRAFARSSCVKETLLLAFFTWTCVTQHKEIPESKCFATKICRCSAATVWVLSRPENENETTLRWQDVQKDLTSSIHSLTKRQQINFSVTQDAVTKVDGPPGASWPQPKIEFSLRPFKQKVLLLFHTNMCYTVRGNSGIQVFCNQVMPLPWHSCLGSVQARKCISNNISLQDVQKTLYLNHVPTNPLFWNPG